MAEVQRRIDGTIGQVTRTGAGALRVPASISRTGVQTYRTEDGQEIREYRPESEVFDAESLASLEGIPVTVLHPPDGVGPENWAALAKGHVQRVIGKEPKADAVYLGAALDVAEGATIARVERKELSEISCGYSAVVVDSPGTAPNGERYDRIQTKIRFNHVALGPPGFARAGREARLRLDGNQVTETIERKEPMLIRIGDVSFDVSNEAGRSSLQSHADALAAKLRESDGKVAAEKARADAAEGRATAEKTRADDATAKLAAAATNIPAIVADEIALRASVLGVLGADFKFDGLTARQVWLAAIAKLRPAADIPADATDDHVKGFLDAALAAPATAEQYTGRADGGAPVNPQASYLARLDSMFTATGTNPIGVLPAAK